MTDGHRHNATVPRRRWYNKSSFRGAVRGRQAVAHPRVVSHSSHLSCMVPSPCSGYASLTVCTLLPNNTPMRRCAAGGLKCLRVPRRQLFPPDKHVVASTIHSTAEGRRRAPKASRVSVRSATTTTATTTTTTTKHTARTTPSPRPSAHPHTLRHRSDQGAHARSQATPLAPATAQPPTARPITRE